MKEKKKEREKDKEMDDGAINHWFENKWVLSFQRKAEEDSDSLSAWGRAFQSLGVELEKAHWSQTAFWCGFHPRLEYEADAERTIEDRVVVHGEELALEDVII